MLLDTLGQQVDSDFVPVSGITLSTSRAGESTSSNPFGASIPGQYVILYRVDGATRDSIIADYEANRRVDFWFWYQKTRIYDRVFYRGRPAEQQLAPDLFLVTVTLEKIVAVTGTFTPAIYGATTPGANTYVAEYGDYTINGSVLHYRMKVTMSAKDAAMSGSVRIGNIPISAKSTALSGSPCSLSSVSNWDYYVVGSGRFLSGEVNPGTNYVSIMLNEPNTAFVALGSGAVTAATGIEIWGSYDI